VRELALRDPGKVSIYLCGPTVYDLPHLGHGRSVLVYDVLRRFLGWRGLEVRFVSNITDIDDQIIRRAAEEGRSETEVTTEFEARYWEAVDALGVRRPDEIPHATAYVDQMVALVAELVAGDHAYETSDGVYLATGTVEGYGLLAGQPLDSLRAGARVETLDEKRSPLDFVLWKKAKPGEPSWPSPWGAGRPGWHTECVVMSLDLLGDGFDLHTGGLDLCFPHHENERAQAVALGRPFAQHWMHHAFVEVGGEKMSKSLKNFTSLTDLLAKVDKRAYRLLVLQAHYRSPIEVTPETLDAAVASLARLDTFARRTADLDGAAVLDGFIAAMEDDLDTPKAVAQLFTTVSRGNAALDAGDAAEATTASATVRTICSVLGLELDDGSDDEVDDATAALVLRRDAARAARDWPAADTARDDLVARGWVVEDTTDGTRIHRR
jgi:cysteinyl-tRNA synthetase